MLKTNKKVSKLFDTFIYVLPKIIDVVFMLFLILYIFGMVAN